MLAISLGSTVLSIWSVRQTAVQIERVNLSHGVYEAYLQLSSNTHRLFIQYKETLLLAQQSEPSATAALIDAVRVDIARIRRLIGAEIEIVGLEEVEELAMLADIERQAERMITAFEGLSAVAQPEPLSPAWRSLASQLTEIDGAFRAHLTEALAEEAREVRETADEVREQIFGHQILALIAVLVALATAVAGLYSIQFTLKTRMEALLGGIRSLA
ncbi:MAG: hypothetical protein AAGI34_16220, partial [Pseudomonadota bacterium]